MELSPILIQAFYDEIEAVEKLASTMSRRSAAGMAALAAGTIGTGTGVVGHQRGKKRGRQEGLQVGYHHGTRRGYQAGAQRGYVAGQADVVRRLRAMQAAKSKKSKGKTKVSSAKLLTAKLVGNSPRLRGLGRNLDAFKRVDPKGLKALRPLGAGNVKSSIPFPRKG